MSPVSATTRQANPLKLFQKTTPINKPIAGIYISLCDRIARQQTEARRAVAALEAFYSQHNTTKLNPRELHRNAMGYINGHPLATPIDLLGQLTIAQEIALKTTKAARRAQVLKFTPVLETAFAIVLAQDPYHVIMNVRAQRLGVYTHALNELNDCRQKITGHPKKINRITHNGKAPGEHPILCAKLRREMAAAEQRLKTLFSTKEV